MPDPEDVVGGEGELDEATVTAGLKEALRIGSERTVATTSAVDGFLANELIRIYLPEELDDMARALSRVGFSRQVDELEVHLQQAVEHREIESRLRRSEAEQREALLQLGQAHQEIRSNLFFFKSGIFQLVYRSPKFVFRDL